MDRRLELFRSEDIVIRHYPRGTDCCVVTFDAISFNLDLDREAFAEEFLASRGISAIHVLSRHNNWYQDKDLPAALTRVEEVTSRYPHVVAYGSSMGGYGVLRYADDVAADLVIAISPQYSLSPERVPFETRWRETAQHVHWGPVDQRPLSPRANAVIIFDPYCRQDQAHVARIGLDRPFEPIAVPFSGHPASTYLAETGVFVPVIEHLIAGKSVGHLVAPVLKKRRETAVYWVTLSEHAYPRSKRRAAALVRKGIEKHPHMPYLWNQLGYVLLNAGRYAEAVSALEQALRLDSTPRITLLIYARALAASGQLTKARIAAGKAGMTPATLAFETLRLWGEHLFLRLVGRL